MNKPDFLRWFNRGFWKAFSRKRFPIQIPKMPTEKAALVELVYHDIASARYAPGIPEAELIINKGYGVARTVPVFSIRDYGRSCNTLGSSANDNGPGDKAF